MLHPIFSRISTRLFLSFLTIIGLVVGAIGLPASGLIEQDLQRQRMERLDQATRATRALLESQQREVAIFAALIAERPTLQQLLRQGDRAALADYLETLRRATPLDEIVVYNGDRSVAAVAPSPTPPSDDQLPAFITTLDVAAVQGATVSAVVWIDDDFLTSLYTQTGTHHGLYATGQRVAASQADFPLQAMGLSDSLTLAGETHYLQTMAVPLGDGTLQDVLALPAGEIEATRASLQQALAGAVGVTSLMAFGLSLFFARSITAPLQTLMAATDKIGQGDFKSPIVATPGITEVATLATTLEQMRSRLQRAYNDLNQEKSWSQNLIASLAEGVITVDAAGRLTSFSPGASRILGWEAGDVLGRPYVTVFRARLDPTESDPPPLSAQQGTITRATVVTRRGIPLSLLITSGAISPLANGNWEQAFVFRDVTEEERALRLREFLLANLSHEFKTPLAALQATAELLATNSATLTESELRELIGLLQQGTLRLSELVDNLLNSANLHTGHFTVRPRPIELEGVLEEVQMSTRPLLLPYGQYVRIVQSTPLPLVQADPRRLQQVLVNLISNASKYGPADAPIVIRAQEAAGMVRVAIHDQGNGVPDALRPHLFQPFARDESQQRSGVGLGLSIVKAIIERHNGRVGVDALPEGGSSFWFTLPIETVSEDEA